ncbi:hypothetical protein EDB80DRAFT_834145 [Ilyonectria destructans]|nr:hypothetical protein EDB80DRAFT_834145 [Ilyonectria destructans]
MSVVWDMPTSAFHEPLARLPGQAEYTTSPFIDHLVAKMPHLDFNRLLFLYQASCLDRVQVEWKDIGYDVTDLSIASRLDSDRGIVWTATAAVRHPDSDDVSFHPISIPNVYAMALFVIYITAASAHVITPSAYGTQHSPTSASSSSMRRPSKGGKKTTNRRQRRRDENMNSRGGNKSSNRDGNNANNRDDDDNDEDDDDDASSGKAKKTWACPYYKFDRKKYHVCCKFMFKRYKNIRDHLSRVHKTGKFWCPTCYCHFPDKGSVIGHIRGGLCSEPPDRHIPRPEGCEDLPIDYKKWYQTFQALHPFSLLPESPYIVDHIYESAVHLRTQREGGILEILQSFMQHQKVEVTDFDLWLLAHNVADKDYDASPPVHSEGDASVLSHADSSLFTSAATAPHPDPAQTGRSMMQPFPSFQTMIMSQDGDVGSAKAAGSDQWHIARARPQSMAPFDPGLNAAGNQGGLGATSYSGSFGDSRQGHNDVFEDLANNQSTSGLSTTSAVPTARPSQGLDLNSDVSHDPPADIGTGNITQHPGHASGSVAANYLSEHELDGFNDVPADYVFDSNEVEPVPNFLYHSQLYQAGDASHSDYIDSFE